MNLNNNLYPIVLDQNVHVLLKVESFYNKLDKVKEKPWFNTKTFNYMANDHLIDWLKMYASRDRTISKDELNFEETFLSFLSKRVSYLKTKLLNIFVR